MILSFVFQLLFAILTGVIFYTLFHQGRPDTQQTINNLLAPIMITLGVFFVLEIKNNLLQYVLFGSLFLISTLNFLYINKEPLYHSLKENDYSEIFDNTKPLNWAYYSNRYWTYWTYNNNTCKNPILQLSNTSYPLEIAPLFISEDDLNNYCKKNAKSPVCLKGHTKWNNQELLDFFTKYEMHYVYLEDNDFVDPTFKIFLKDYAFKLNDNLWKLKFVNIK